MALDDIVFPASEDDFILEIPSATYTGSLNDIVFPDKSGPVVMELTQGFYPPESDVENGVDYGPTGTEYEGNVTLPVESNVKTGVTYGANGTEFTGTYGGGSAGPFPVVGPSIVIRGEGRG